MRSSSTCIVEVGMRDPPRDPSAIDSDPRQAIVGLMEDSMRAPAATEFASPCTRPNRFGLPGDTTKSSISLLSRNPAPFT